MLGGNNQNLKPR